MKILVVDAVRWGDDHKYLDYPKDVGMWICEGIGGDAERFVRWRICFDPEPTGAFNGQPPDGVIISGSPASAYDTDPWIGLLSERIRQWRDQNVPMLGICFGHQILAHALGGRVIKNPEGWEAGTLPVELTEAGRRDSIFEGLPDQFLGMQSHQDVVIDPPPGAIILARSGVCACQAMAIGDRIRSVQFHPEYTPEHLAFIIGPRRKRLTEAGVDVDAALGSICSTPHAARVLANFENHFLCRD